MKLHMTKINLILSLSLALIAPPSFSSESNLDNFNYPSHSCGTKVKKPKKPKRLTSNENIDKYNSAIVEYNINVAAYNKEIKIYKSCINRYINNGNHDINIIRKILNSALKEARTN